ncbi:hypothetical protein [Cylindrospermum sp. FACHB-282]|uniref:hypothetical protein n=1 Tax=Cylindrospermum sp. FACHB-282 TaxID=2692794 RepID=UPI001682D398|nr:hypothetical protein [Cylindrospermum sp. FACHB-282]MBD2386021.1 hypothetical protein [Cylindrospermum sp. FACHB-282]
MIGQLFTTGIQVKQVCPGNENKWLAFINFTDESHSNLDGVHGTISNKYGNDLLAACRTVLEDAGKMGIKTVNFPNIKPKLYIAELFVNNPDVWQQIEFAANILEFEVSNCLPKE